MVPNAGGVVLLERACFVLDLQLPCTLRGSAPHRSDGTRAAGTDATDLVRLQVRR